MGLAVELLPGESHRISNNQSEVNIGLGNGL